VPHGALGGRPEGDAAAEVLREAGQGGVGVACARARVRVQRWWCGRVGVCAEVVLWVSGCMYVQRWCCGRVGVACGRVHPHACAWGVGCECCTRAIRAAAAAPATQGRGEPVLPAHMWWGSA